MIAVAALIACSDDEDDGKDKTNDIPVKNLQIPIDTIPLQRNAPVLLKGRGFLSNDQVWLKVPTTDISKQATVTQVTETSLTFTATGISGRCEAYLKRDGKEYLMGRLLFEYELLPKE